MSPRSKHRKKIISFRTFVCPGCGGKVRFPVMWMMGIESVFQCPGCGTPFRTGYKMGAVWFALALTAAVVTANLGAYLISSYSIPVMALLIIPLWLLYGFLLRRWWLVRKAYKRYGKSHG